jgi:hypothetical protein
VVPPLSLDVDGGVPVESPVVAVAGGSVVSSVVGVLVLVPAIEVDPAVSAAVSSLGESSPGHPVRVAHTATARIRDGRIERTPER